MSEADSKSVDLNQNIISDGDTTVSQLLEAAAAYDLENIRKLLSGKVDPNSRNKDGNSALHLLLNNGLQNRETQSIVLDCLQELVGRGGDIFGTNSKGESPLYLTLFSGLESCAVYLVNEYLSEERSTEST